ncbi:hypothetical protein RAAC3_TM7C00001G0823 [Candidatus Saccharibacteria bacterium RAAC3_TM7_1]|nr:hypothetical protein RAAC3_TM7C00001G0823 [Candidatus Saccharibacteria bacterium RAAC3_TM7_1]
MYNGALDEHKVAAQVKQKSIVDARVKFALTAGLH